MEKGIKLEPLAEVVLKLPEGNYKIINTGNGVIYIGNDDIDTRTFEYVKGICADLLLKKVKEEVDKLHEENEIESPSYHTGLDEAYWTLEDLLKK